MRFLLLLLLALGTAIVMPVAIYGVQPELLPGGGSVWDAWSDLGEVGRIAQDAWRTGQEPADPRWDETRIARALTVGGTAAIWLCAFLTGGLLGLILMRVRRVTLAIVAVVLVFGLYGCSHVQVTHDLSPETVKLLKRFFGLAVAAALAGFLTARSMRRVAV